MTSILVLKGTNSDAFISEPKAFFSIFFCVSEMKIKFSTFWKNKLALKADVFSKIRTGKDVVS